MKFQQNLVLQTLKLIISTFTLRAPWSQSLLVIRSWRISLSHKSPITPFLSCLDFHALQVSERLDLWLPCWLLWWLCICRLCVRKCIAASYPGQQLKTRCSGSKHFKSLKAGSVCLWYSHCSMGHYGHLRELSLLTGRWSILTFISRLMPKSKECCLIRF